MLRRKITEKLLKWKHEKDRLPLVIKGCRQCGKTRAVLEFAKENYEQIGNMFNAEYIDKYMNQMNDLMKDVNKQNGAK